MRGGGGTSKAIYSFEPFLKQDRRLDQKWLQYFCKKYQKDDAFFLEKNYRVIRLENLTPEQVDIILSHSVLEHVANIGDLIYQMRAVLKPDGVMIHLVDYRDHFFKFPYHFLQFNESSWGRFLNPGDLTRVRLSHHVKTLQEAGFHVEVMDKKRDLEAFERIKPHIAPCFDRSDPDLNVLQATLICRLK